MRLTAGSVHMDDALIRSRPFASGDGGNVALNVGTLTLTGGSRIDTSSMGDGRGGQLTVAATDAIAIAGHDREGFTSGLFSFARGSGDAGLVAISTPRLTMDEGLIATPTVGAGRAGDIVIQVGRSILTGGAVIDSSTFGAGQGGDIALRARHVELGDGAVIWARSTGAGAAGTIQIQADETFRSAGGHVTTESASAGGGAIALTAGRLVQLMDSELTTSVRGGDENAGNITIDTIDPQFVILENSKIRADAFGGMGGNIRIDAGVFLADPASLVSACSALGIQGTVDIRAPVTSLSGALAPLPQAFVSAAALLPARCAARLSGGTYSSLVLGGRDGLPLNPGGVLPSPLTLDESVGGPAVDGTPHQQKTPAKFALLAVADKVFPRLHRGNVAWGCSK